ncbi:MAG: hypothetical protein ABJA83_10745 [Burkholderiaceae bacterium]
MAPRCCSKLTGNAIQRLVFASVTVAVIVFGAVLATESGIAEIDSAGDTTLSAQAAGGYADDESAPAKTVGDEATDTSAIEAASVWY